MARAANIVPQIGKARSKSGFEIVSYQITRTVQCRTGKNSLASQSRAPVGLRSDAKSSRIAAQSSASREGSL